MLSLKDEELLTKLKSFDEIKTEFEQLVGQIRKESASLEALQNDLQKDYDRKIEVLKRKFELLDNYKREIIDDLNKIISEKTIGFPWLADAISQYIEIETNDLDDHLRYKRNPAKKAAKNITIISAEKKILRKKFLLARNLCKYYESLFPGLQAYVNENIDDALLSEFSGEFFEPDPGVYYAGIEKIDFESEHEKHQYAFDKWKKRKKSSWEIGRIYERYIGSLYENKGWDVTYEGILKKLEDQGRDLICFKDNETRIIQCKYWQQNKVIHENHVYQLFGTTVKYLFDKFDLQDSSIQGNLFPDLLLTYKVTPYFYTSCTFSDTAKQVAKVLNINLIESKPLDYDYPMIKCNINRQTNERIYHLPFDQQYDSTKVEFNRGECYVNTVMDAVSKNFRRAWRWRGNNLNEI